MGVNYKQSDAELVGHLHAEKEFMEASARAFDDGNYAEAARLAVSVRKLCYDTPRSHALLAQLGVLSTLRFVDTIRPPDAEPVPEPGSEELNWITLINAPLVPLTGGQLGFRPRLGDGARFNPKPFAEWAEATVLETREVRMTRFGIVLALANWDGGAHVDPIINDQDYVAISRGNALGTIEYVTSDGQTHSVEVNPAFPNMRQIAYEVLETIKPLFGE